MFDWVVRTISDLFANPICGISDHVCQKCALRSLVAENVANLCAISAILLRSESVGGSQALIDDQVV